MPLRFKVDVYTRMITKVLLDVHDNNFKQNETGKMQWKLSTDV